jgi:hypothetical protein
MGVILHDDVILHRDAEIGFLRVVGAREKVEGMCAAAVSRRGVELVAIVYGATTAGQDGWGSPVVWTSFAIAAIALAAFRATERRVSQPLISLTVLAKRHVAWGNIAGLLAFATETSLVFPLTLYFQDVLGFSSLTAGHPDRDRGQRRPVRRRRHPDRRRSAALTGYAADHRDGR